MAIRCHLWDLSAHLWVAAAAAPTKKLFMLIVLAAAAAPNLAAACPPADAPPFHHILARGTFELVAHSTALSLSSAAPTLPATAPVSVPIWPRRRPPAAAILLLHTFLQLLLVAPLPESPPPLPCRSARRHLAVPSSCATQLRNASKRIKTRRSASMRRRCCLILSIRAGLKNEIEVMSHSKTKPLTLARLGEVPKGFAAFGRGFVGIDDSRQLNNHRLQADNWRPQGL